MLALSIRWFGENTKINKEAVVQVVLQRMWLDTTNGYMPPSDIFMARWIDFSKYNDGEIVQYIEKVFVKV